MTIEEFNDKYYVNVTAMAEQKITEITETDVIYGEVTDVIENIDYGVYDMTTDELVFTYTGSDDSGFLDAVFEEFDITH